MPRKTAKANYSAKKVASDMLGDPNKIDDEQAVDIGEEGPDGEKDVPRTLKKNTVGAVSMRK